MKYSLFSILHDETPIYIDTFQGNNQRARSALQQNDRSIKYRLSIE